MQIRPTDLHFNQSVLEEDFKRVSDDSMKKVIKYLNNSDSFTRIFEFAVDGADHYFISLFRDGSMEIHFGHYKKKAFGDLWLALEKQDVDTVQKLLKEKNLLRKDDRADYPEHALEILISNVMAMLIKVVEKNDPVSIKIMGQSDGFNLYRKFILDHIHLLPNYYLGRDTFDDCYAKKDSHDTSAKAILLRSKLADSGKYNLTNHDLLLGE